jgi:hypothetical protein
MIPRNRFLGSLNVDKFGLGPCEMLIRKEVMCESLRLLIELDTLKIIANRQTLKRRQV